MLQKTIFFSIFSDPPYIDRRPEFTKLAFARGAPATLICRASGFPEVDFTWFIKRGRPDDKMESFSIFPFQVCPGLSFPYSPISLSNDDVLLFAN